MRFHFYQQNQDIKIEAKRHKASKGDGGPAASSKLSVDTGVDGNSASYVEDMYNNWKQDPASVHTVYNVHPYFSDTLSLPSLLSSLPLSRF